MTQEDSNNKHPETQPRLPELTLARDNKVVIVGGSVAFATGLIMLLFGLIREGLGHRVLAVAMTLIVVSIVLAYFNYLKPASIIITTAAFIVMTFFLYEGDGIHDASITAYSAVVILGGLLLGEVGVISFGLLTTTSLIILAYAEYAGLLVNKYSGLFDLIDISVFWFLHLATSIIIYILVRRLSRIALEAQIREKAFSNANAELFVLRDNLQNRINQRTSTLEEQNTNLQAAARVAHEILAAKDVSQSLEMSVKLIASEFNYDHASIFLLNEKKDHALLQAASSLDGKKMLEEHYELPIDRTSVVGIVAADKKPRVAFNQEADMDFFDNPNLPDIQSEMALPLMVQDEIIGILDIQSRQSEAFGQTEITIFRSLTNQLALTIQNVRLIEEAQINLAQLELIISEQSREVWDQYLKRQSHGFIYTPLGVKPLRASKGEEMSVEERSGAEKAEIPISLRGKKIGSISLQRLARNWTKKEKALLDDVATQIGLAIENARLLNETREQARQEQLISEVSSKMRETLDMDTVLKTAIEEMRKTFNLKEVEVRLTSSDNNKGKN